ncbi:hypothetical protein [Aquibium microcysteis]|uniref:hypothetical protein n=1 Tax=Aquibium microcysteis TaxID=675281 RepID=UPI00165CF642|nr:hypothetical protein [Aquibium microcysteis]
MQKMFLCVALLASLIGPATAVRAQTADDDAFSVTIRLQNATSGLVDYYLLDPGTGGLEYYATMPPGGVVEQLSAEGIVWVFGANQREIARYSTTGTPDQIFTIAPQTAPAGAVALVQPPEPTGIPDGDIPQSLNGPAHADGFSWNYARYVDDVRSFGLTASLSLSVAETDQSRFSATCSRGSGGRIAAEIAADLGAIAPFSDVAIDFVARGASQTVPARSFVPESSEGFAGFRLDTGADDRLWQVFSAMTELRYGPRGAAALRLDLAGIGGSLAAFLGDCRRFAAEAANPALAMTIPPACGPQGVKRSFPGAPVTVEFVNATGEFRNLTWVDAQGTFVQIVGLNDGEATVVRTSTGHVWEFTDGPGNCIEAYRPAATETRLTISRKSPGFGPE